MLRQQSEAFYLFRREGIGELVYRHAETRVLQPFLVVPAIDPYVIALPENFFPLFGAGDAEIFKGLIDNSSVKVVFDRHDEDGKPIRFQNAPNLLHRAKIVFNMLKYMGAEDDIESIIAERRACDIFLAHRLLGIDVRADVIDVWIGLEQTRENFFRRKMKHLDRTAGRNFSLEVQEV